MYEPFNKLSNKQLNLWWILSDLENLSNDVECLARDVNKQSK